MATGGGEHNLSDECFDVKCTICTRKNRNKQAQKYCIECKKNLCFDCVEIHSDYNEGHTLVDGHGEDGEVNLLTEKCEKHKDKLIELFCVDHDKLVCNSCALLEHRTCGKLKNITDFIEDFNEDQKVHGVPGQLKTTLQDVDQVLSALEQHIEELSQHDHKLLEEIEEYTKRLLAKIEILQRNARQAVSDKHEQAASEATGKRNACVTAKTSILKCMDEMASVGNRKAHLFILKKRGQALTKNVETLCRESGDITKRVKLMYKPDLQIEDKLNEFISLITVVEKYKVSSKVNIDASVKGDSKSCDIYGCCLLSDGTVLLADIHNHRVKQVNPSSCTIKDHCDLKDRPLGVTCITPHQVAVCTGRTTIIQIVSLGYKMTCTSTIELKHNCSRIAQSDGELFTTDSNCVYVHDLTGTLLRTICKNESEKNMFSHIWSIVLDQTGDRVYVADSKRGLICTDRAGQEVFKLSEEELGLSGAYGVCTDQRGNVLVCGYWSSNVVQVTEDGRVLGEILSKADGIVNPQCMCYDTDRRRLYVGGNTSNLLMYQLM